jgi:hypothetical protein
MEKMDGASSKCGNENIFGSKSDATYQATSATKDSTMAKLVLITRLLWN